MILQITTKDRWENFGITQEHKVKQYLVYNLNIC